jgi:GNAT superfamily N-acetyltransferase
MIDVAPISTNRGAYEISTDPARFDYDAIHAYLTGSYWAAGISRELVERAIRATPLSFGLFHGARQIGFARVISDGATFGYLADVYVLEEFRGQGLGKWLMSVVMAHPELQGLRRFLLATRDAHGLYAQFGFGQLTEPARYMVIHRPDVYRRS